MPKKKTIIIIGIIILVFIFVGLIKDQLIKSAVTLAASQVTGAPVSIKSFSLGVFSQKVSISGFKMYNPKGFPKEPLISMPAIKVNYRLGELLFKKKLHLPLVEIDLKEAVIIKNKDGNLNVNSLKIAEKKEEQGKEKKKKEPRLAMQIDTLNLKIGKVIYKDFTAGEKPSVEAYVIGIKRTYKNVTSPEVLAALLLSASFEHTAIKGASLYGVSTLAGMAILPVGVANIFVSKDSASLLLKVDFEKAYKASLDSLNKLGTATKETKTSGIIKGKIKGSDVAIKIVREEGKDSKITVSARKYLLPKPEIAEGLLYEIKERIR